MSTTTPTLRCVLVAAALLISIPPIPAGGGAEEQEAELPSPLPIATMSELMVQIIYPTSDAVLYISTRTPETDAQWTELQAKTLMLAESANLLMMPSRIMEPKEQWLRDAQLMLDAGSEAFEAAMEKDLDALIELNDPVYQSCIVCHKHFRPDYGR